MARGGGGIARLPAMTVAKRALLRGNLVEVRRKGKRRSATSQREARLEVESIVNSGVEPRQACLLSHGLEACTLAREGVDEYAAERAREAGVSGRVRRVLRYRKDRVDTCVCLRGPDEPVVVLGIEAPDQRVEACRAH